MLTNNYGAEDPSYHQRCSYLTPKIRSRGNKDIHKRDVVLTFARVGKSCSRIQASLLSNRTFYWMSDLVLSRRAPSVIYQVIAYRFAMTYRLLLSFCCYSLSFSILDVGYSYTIESELF